VEYADAIVMASSLDGALLSLQPAATRTTIASPTMLVFFTVYILSEVRTQDTP
jgi:hypothetical protein